MPHMKILKITWWVLVVGAGLAAGSWEHRDIISHMLMYSVESRVVMDTPYWLEQARREGATLGERQESIRRALWYLGESVGWDSRVSESQAEKWAREIADLARECHAVAPEWKLGMAEYSSFLDFQSLEKGAELFSLFIRAGVVDFSDRSNPYVRELPLAGFRKRLQKPMLRQGENVVIVRLEMLASERDVEWFSLFIREVVVYFCARCNLYVRELPLEEVRKRLLKPLLRRGEAAAIQRLEALARKHGADADAFKDSDTQE